MNNGSIAMTIAEPSTPLGKASGKAFRRLVWFLFLCYVISYLDRINISFAALSMNKALGLSAASFGLASTIFYTGYVLCEVPSNMMMVRFGARRWIARIMITWGIASVLTMFATGSTSLHLLRLLVGIAEAGFLPGVILYLTYWFPAECRGRVTALFMIAQPVTLAFGSLLATFIMQSFDTSLGLAGWQWLFVLTGVPAVVLGICVLFYLPDGPVTATWLEPAEREALMSRLALEAPAHGAGRSGGSLLTPAFLKMCAAYFCLTASLNTLATWSPLIVRSVVGPGASLMSIGMLAAIPGIAAACAMPLWAAASDRRQERYVHYAIPLAVAVVGWLCVASSGIPAVQMLGLVLSTAGAFTGMVIIWTLPPRILSVAARPYGIALLSCSGIAASVTSPYVIGLLHDATGSFAAGFWLLMALLILSILLVLSIRGTGTTVRAGASGLIPEPKLDPPV